MQAVASRAAQKVVVQRRVAAARVAPRSTLRVVCQAQSSEVAKKVALVSSLPASLLASAAPAFALVDERLNGDGVGLPLGVNDGALGWAIAGVFTLIWILYFTSQKDLGEFEDPEDGLKL